MAALLGLAAAIGYGAADFFGGWASRRAAVLAVVLWSQVAGLVALLVVLAPLTTGGPSADALLWGAAAGAVVTVGLVVYFRGLARARMGVVTPVTAVVTATLPVCVGLAAGERPSSVALAGVLVALTAVAAVSLAPPHAAHAGPAGPLAPASAGVAQAPPAAPAPRVRTRVGPAPGVVEALVAGVGFGLYFVCMDRAGSGAVVWPLVASTATSLVLLAAAAVATGRPWRPARAAAPIIVASGLCAAAASLAFLLAVRQGLLSLVSVLASLSPAVTVALARLLMAERMSRVQLAGLAAAVAGVGLIAAG